MKALTLFLFVTTSGLAQITPPPPPSAPLAVYVHVQFEGYELPDGEAVHPPANFFVSPFVQTTLPLRAGDTVTIDIYADGLKLSSQKAVWHEEINPSKNARPGEAIPMFIQPAQFFYENTQWTNVPEGTHVLLAHAYDFRGLSAFSTAIHITVLPPLPPQSVSGTHEAIGPPRPALKPEQVRIMHRPPRQEYQVVGIVTARAPGQWSFDVASAELKKQAAQLGANWVILNQSHWVNPINKKNRVFIEPESHLSGKALYVPSIPQPTAP
jgi:hypothetical protein